MLPHLSMLCQWKHSWSWRTVLSWKSWLTLIKPFKQGLTSRAPAWNHNPPPRIPGAWDKPCRASAMASIRHTENETLCGKTIGRQACLALVFPLLGWERGLVSGLLSTVSWSQSQTLVFWRHNSTWAISDEYTVDPGTTRGLGLYAVKYLCITLTSLQNLHSS